MKTQIETSKFLMWLVPLLLGVLVALLGWVGSVMERERLDSKEFRKISMNYFRKQDSAWIVNSAAHASIMASAGASTDRLYLYKNEVLQPALERIDINGKSIIELEKVNIEQDARLTRIENKTGLY